MPDALSPQNLAFIICDSIIEDRETGKKTLVGIFNRVNAKTFPVRHPALSVFVSLTEGRGRCQAQLQCVKSSEGNPILEVEGPVEFQSPNAVVELGFNIRGITFPEPGLYEFQFLCDGVLVGNRPFEVLKLGEQR
ncbi:MAG: hypothetical protein JW889_16485 [Verrucomicrobia bacterium]|nr:hypothetical protein [Verrucomicrobiota bacterium]